MSVHRWFFNKPNYKHFEKSRNYYATKKKGPSNVEIICESRGKIKITRTILKAYTQAWKSGTFKVNSSGNVQESLWR